MADEVEWERRDARRQVGGVELAAVLAWTAFGLYTVQLLAWIAVFTRTTQGVLSGQLLPPAVGY